MLIIAALIWGVAFSAQRAASGTLDAISFNGLRFAISAFTLLLVVLVSDFIAKKRGKKPQKFSKGMVASAFFCGFIMFMGNNAQQIGLESTTAGKSGFITALYIVIVPIMGLLAGKKTSSVGFMAVMVAIAGFWTMSVNDDFSITDGDIMVLLCAFIFAFHILFIDIFAGDYDAVKFTFLQFVMAATLSVPAMAINGFPKASDIESVIIPLLYVGIFSSAIAFTLQVAGQQHTEPALATLLMSLESVFGLFGGIIILHESSTPKELAGCLMVFIAVFMAQHQRPTAFMELPLSEKKKIMKNPSAFSDRTGIV